jgi:hypothetical protein
MPKDQPNVATGDGRVPTKKSKKSKPAKTSRPRPSSGGSPAKGGYDWGDGKGKIHSIPLTEHKRNVEARGYGIDLKAPLSQPLNNQQAYGMAQQSADRVYQPQIDQVSQMQASVPGWYANYMAQVAAQQSAQQAYAQPLVQQAQAGVQNAGATAPGLDPGSAQYATEQKAAQGRQSIAQLGADTLSAIPAATNAYMGGQAITAARELPMVLQNYGVQKGQLQAQRGQAVTENYSALRGQEQNAAIAYGTLGLNTSKAAADVDLGRGVDPVTGRPLPQDAPKGYAPGGPGLNKYGYTADEWQGLSQKQRDKARAGTGKTQAQKDQEKAAKDLEKRKAAIKKTTGKLKVDVENVVNKWNSYVGQITDDTSKPKDPATGEYPPRKITPADIKRILGAKHDAGMIHVALLVRAGKPLDSEAVQYLRSKDPNIRIPREWLKGKSSRPSTSRPANAPAGPGSSESRPT